MLSVNKGEISSQPVLIDIQSTVGNPVAGSGLGLAIARGIIEAHGGFIVAISRPECGAIIQFTLSVAEAQ